MFFLVPSFHLVMDFFCDHLARGTISINYDFQKTYQNTSKTRWNHGADKTECANRLAVTLGITNSLFMGCSAREFFNLDPICDVRSWLRCGNGTMTSPPRNLRSKISQWPPPHFQSRALLRWGWQWGRCTRLTSFRCGWEALHISSTKSTDSNTQRNTWRSYKIKTLQDCNLWTQTNPSFWTCGKSTCKYETWLHWPFSCWNSQRQTYTQLFHIKISC